MRNTIVFIAWTLLFVIVSLTGIAFYIVSTSDGTATYAQMGYDTGQQFVKVLLVSIVIVVLGKHKVSSLALHVPRPRATHQAHKIQETPPNYALERAVKGCG
jgi:hypothetical protein